MTKIINYGYNIIVSIVLLQEENFYLWNVYKVKGATELVSLRGFTFPFPF